MQAHPLHMTKKQVYNDPRYRRARAAALRRDQYRCQECRRYGRNTTATMVHHVEALEDHPERAFDPANLRALCDACHNAMHPEKGGNRGRTSNAKAR